MSVNNFNNYINRLVVLSSTNIQDEIQKTGQTYSSGQLTNFRKQRSFYPIIPRSNINETTISILNNPMIVSQISADGEEPTRDISNNCWGFINENLGEKINWYFLADFTDSVKITDFEYFYFVVRIKNTNDENKPWITLYTTPGGNGVPGFFTTRYNYTNVYLNGSNYPLTENNNYVFYIGNISNADISSSYTNDLSLNSSPIITGPASNNETVAFITIQTDSSASANTFNFCVKEVGYKFKNKNQERIFTTA